MLEKFPLESFHGVSATPFKTGAISYTSLCYFVFQIVPTVLKGLWRLQVARGSRAFFAAFFEPQVFSRPCSETSRPATRCGTTNPRSSLASWAVGSFTSWPASCRPKQKRAGTKTTASLSRGNWFDPDGFPVFMLVDGRVAKWLVPLYSCKELHVISSGVDWGYQSRSYLPERSVQPHSHGRCSVVKATHKTLSSEPARTDPGTVKTHWSFMFTPD